MSQVKQFHTSAGVHFHLHSRVSRVNRLYAILAKTLALVIEDSLAVDLSFQSTNIYRILELHV